MFYRVLHTFLPLFVYFNVIKYVNGLKKYLGLPKFWPNLWWSEAALQRFSWEKVFWKYAANLQNTHAEVRFYCNLLKSHFSIGVLQYICCRFSEHLYWTPTLNDAWRFNAWCPLTGHTYCSLLQVCLSMIDLFLDTRR